MVAGVVSTWWFAPEDAGACCSVAIKDSFVRATTTSFGSICFGSLLVAIIQAVKAMVQSARNNDEMGPAGVFLLCLVECLLRCLEDVLQFFNKFAYVYVGMVSPSTFVRLRNPLGGPTWVSIPCPRSGNCNCSGSGDFSPSTPAWY